MPGKRQLFRDREDADFLPFLSFSGGIARQDESRLERFISRAIACISLSSRPRASVKMASGLPVSGVCVKTSS